jgi:FtsP/CotA-like multicopper oxidase with cupredoxin domain
MSIKKSFKLNRIAVAVAMATTAAVPQIATAGAGWGDTTYADGRKMQTYSANSPTGILPAGSCFSISGAAGTGADCDTGVALKKFVDTLPGLTAAGANNLGNYIPVAVAQTLSAFPNDDYYAIAVVEYTQQMHSNLAAPTTLRGYVQVDLAATDSAAGLSNGAAAFAAGASQAVPLTNSHWDAATSSVVSTPAMISRPDATSATGFRTVQAYGVDTPHYLGPVIAATTGRPTRITFYNALPVGRADAANRNGDLFLPVDETLPGAGYGPDGKVKYTQNRAVLHLHGGDNPWISDGTPQQWITPAEEANAANPLSVAAEAIAKGANPSDYVRAPGAINVPDMADPGPGAMNYYYPNGMSARLEWYHDHSFGLTRLNVFAGEVSGYLVTDDFNNALMGRPTSAGFVAPTGLTAALAGVPEIPLIIQDKSFVPKNIGIQDAKWDQQFWGPESSLYYPHVWETNQDPNSGDATNPVGRWDWGPFFWPVFPSAMDLPTGEHKIYPQAANAASLPATAGKTTRQSWTNAALGNNLPGPSDLGLSEVTTTPEAFVDTPMVNGVPYPVVYVDPRLYRFKILNGANDRMFNLGFYVAAHTSQVDTASADPVVAYTNTALCAAGDAPADCTEVKMVPFNSPNSAYNTTFACPAPVAPSTTGFTAVSAAYPNAFPCDGGLLGSGWGQSDNRPGGVPDPASVGPSMHLIGNEGGFVPARLEIPSTPFNYEYNKRSVTVLNVLEHGLMLATAQRADVLVDFSQYAGKTLILYNDAAAPVPAGDPRLDYYTMIGDQTAAGGAPNTLPGYGPNTRTVMQVVVNGVPPAPATDFTAIDTALTAAYTASQSKPIVPQTAYNVGGWNFGSTDVFGKIFTGAIYLGKYQALSFTTTDSLKYTPAPGSVAISGWSFNDPLTATVRSDVPQCGTPATCTSLVAAVKAAGPASVVAGVPVSMYVENKTIQELFDPTWGRMNATLGVELPFVSSLTQTTIPLGYVDPATETVSDGETQIWKVTHNGVDSHPVHFHLVNVQVINRVGWDGTVKGIDPEEAGWKETVRMNPLEDVLVAVRAKKPAMPFGLPHSYRALDPSQPVGPTVTGGFTQVNPVDGTPAVVSNAMDDFMNEYVWHCHILGHEENDFMRAVKFDPKDVAAAAPSGVSVARTGTGPITVTWTDTTPAAAPATLTSHANEIGFRVERAVMTGTTYGTPQAVPAGLHQINAITHPINTLANATTFTFSDAVAPQGTAPRTPSNVNAVLNGNVPQVTWRDTGTVATAPASFNVLRAEVANGIVGAFAQVNVAPVTVPSSTSGNGNNARRNFTFNDTTAKAGSVYEYQVQAVGVGGSAATYAYRVVAINATATDSASGWSATTTTATSTAGTASSAVTSQVTVPMAAPAAVNIAFAAGATATASWAAVPNAAAYVLTYTVGTSANTVLTTTTLNTTNTSFSLGSPDLIPGQWLTVSVIAVSVDGVQSLATSSATVKFAAPARPTTPTIPAATVTATGLTLNWGAVAGATGYTVRQATNNAFTAGLVTVPNLTTNTYAASGLAANTRYYFNVSASNLVGTSAVSNTVNTWTAAVAPTTVTAAPGTAGGTVTAGLTFSGGTASSYDVRWANANTMNGATTVTGRTSGQQVTIGGTARTVYMQVRAINGNNTATGWVPTTPVAVSAQ